MILKISQLESPSIAKHISPDGDAIRSKISIFLKNRGSTPIIFLNQHDRLPPFFDEILSEENINFIEELTDQPFDGLIKMDAANEAQFEENT